MRAWLVLVVLLVLAAPVYGSFQILDVAPRASVCGVSEVSRWDGSWFRCVTQQAGNGSGGSPGGPDNSVQFNDNGVLNGSGDFTWDGSEINLSGDLNFVGANHDMTNVGDITFQSGATGGTIRTGTSSADKWRLMAYDVNGMSYVTVAEADAGNDPTFEVFAPYFQIWDSVDTTKHVMYNLSLLSTGAERMYKFPNQDGTFALTGDLSSYLRNDGDVATGNYTFDTNTLFVDSTNNRVGIGTNTPAYPLHINGSHSISQKIYSDQSTARLSFEGIGTIVVEMLTSQSVGNDFWLSNNGLDFLFKKISNSNSLGNFKIRNASNVDSVKFRLDAPVNTLTTDKTGFVGIGTASPSSKLDVVGTVEINTLGSASSTHLCINGSNVVSSCSSSIRYKESVSSVNADVRDAVNDLRVVTYRWKGGSITGKYETIETYDDVGEINGSVSVWVPTHTNDFNRKHVGLIAEEVKLVADSHTNGNVVLTFNNLNGQVEGIDYDALVAVLTKNIQTLNEENEQLKAAVTRLCQASPGVCV